MVSDKTSLRIGILACDALKDEIEQFVADDPDIVYKEYLEFGLHLTPDTIRKTIVEKVRGLEGKVDALFLGYGYCQALRGLPDEVKVPTIMLETDDCIAALITAETYLREKHNGGITWFYPAGWAKYGYDGLVRMFKLDQMAEKGFPPEFFFQVLFNGFSRCLYIDTGVGDAAAGEANSKQLAAKLGLRHECMNGSLNMIEEALARTKCLAEQSRSAVK